MRRGDPDERRMYMIASSTWDEAGRPDVPLITEWFVGSQASSTWDEAGRPDVPLITEWFVGSQAALTDQDS